MSLYLQSVTKYFVKSKKIKQNSLRPKNVDICFCLGFDWFCQKLIIGGETAH